MGVDISVEYKKKTLDGSKIIYVSVEGRAKHALFFSGSEFLINVEKFSNSLHWEKDTAEYRSSSQDYEDDFEDGEDFELPSDLLNTCGKILIVDGDIQCVSACNTGEIYFKGFDPKVVAKAASVEFSGMQVFYKTCPYYNGEGISLEKFPPKFLEAFLGIKPTVVDISRTFVTDETISDWLKTMYADSRWAKVGYTNGEWAVWQENGKTFFYAKKLGYTEITFAQRFNIKFPAENAKSNVNRIYVEALEEWLADGIKIANSERYGGYLRLSWDSELSLDTKKIVLKNGKYYAEKFSLTW